MRKILLSTHARLCRELLELMLLRWKWILLILCYHLLSISDGLTEELLQSCNITQLARAGYDPQVVRRLLYVLEWKFFNVPCTSSIPTSGSSLWDQYLAMNTRKISVFVHIGVFSRTGVVLNEIFTALQLSGLWNISKIHVGISGSFEKISYLNFIYENSVITSSL